MSERSKPIQLPPIPPPEIERVLESITDGFVMMNPEWQFTYVNRVAEKLIGKTREQVLGKDVWEQFGPEATEASFKRRYEEVMRDRKPIEFEEYAPSIGSWFEVRAYPAEGGGVSIFFRDVTTRRRAESDLQMMASVVGSSTEFIGLCTPDFHPFFVNDAGRQLVGLDTLEEAIRTPVLDYFWPEDRSMIVSQAIPTLLKSGQWSGEVRFRNFKTGEPIYTRWNVFAIKNSAGETLAYATVSPNLTSLHAAEDALQRSEERFRVLVDAMPQIVWTATPEGDQDFANKRWYEFAGMAEGDRQTSEPWRAIMHPDDVKATEDTWKRAVATGEHYSHIHRIRRHDGAYRWLLSRAVPQRNTQGKIVRWLGTGTDITDLKEAEDARRASEAALRVSEERMRIAASAAKLGYFDWDLTNDSFVCSPRIKEMFGVPDKTVTNVRELAEQLHPEDRPRREQLLKSALDNRSDYDIEYRVIWPDKSVHWISTRGRAYYDEAGKPIRFGGVMADVTERKELEQALIRSEKLASVGRMAATIAHEINNPLAAVMNLLFLAGSDPELPESARNYLFTAQQEIERAAHITKQTLGFYREASRPRRVDVREVVEGVLELFSQRLVNRAIKVERRYQGDLHVHVIEGELRQVISNLVSNAIDATPEQDGRLRIHARDTDVAGLGQAVRIVIADNGSGIAPDVKARIFEPFFTTKVSVGTGLGLWVTRDIVGRSGGRIRVKSQLGKGSVFSILLPEGTVSKAETGT